MKNYKILFFSSFCVILLFLFFYFMNKITAMQHAQNQLSEFTAKTQMREFFYNLNFVSNNEMTGKIASDVLCTGLKNEEKPLSDFVRGKSLLVYRYAYMKCSSCNEYEISFMELNDVFSEAPDLTLILCSSHVFKNFLLFKRKNNMEIPLYSISLNAFDWLAEKNDSPYYFVLHPDMKISHIYIPSKDYPEMNRQYLEGVKRFLSERELSEL